MKRRTITRLGASMAIVAALAGTAMHTAPAHAAATSCTGLPCILYYTEINPQPGCINCVSVYGRALAGDPLIVSAIDGITGALVAQRQTGANSRGTFTTLLNVTQCTTDPLLINARDMRTGITSNTVQLTLICH